MKTKDYIYLDENLLNSHLAQFEKGLLIKETNEYGTESSDSEGGSSTAISGLDGIFGIGAKLQGEYTENDSSMESEFTKNVVENVLSDYAVNLLIQDCKNHGVLKDFNIAKEGDFISCCSSFQIYDFEYLKSITDPGCLTPILESHTQNPGSQATKKQRTDYLVSQKKSQKGTEGFKMIHNFSSFADKLFANSILIRVSEGLAICKRQKLRLTPAQISFENEAAKKIKIFGTISTIKEKTYPVGLTKSFKPSNLDKVSSILFDIVLSSFNMLHNNDKIIKPIAIYFEAD